MSSGSDLAADLIRSPRRVRPDAAGDEPDGRRHGNAASAEPGNAEPVPTAAAAAEERGAVLEPRRVLTKGFGGGGSWGDFFRVFKRELREGRKSKEFGVKGKREKSGDLYY